MEHSKHETLEKSIGYTFQDKTLLAQALTHKSYTNEHTDAPDNERLEFFGDAILQFVTSDFLYASYPETDEGKLTLYRSLLVKTDFLIRIGSKLSLKEHIRISSGQRMNLQTPDSSIIADAVEALISAIYLDGGISQAERFIRQVVLEDAKEYLQTISIQDSKSEFQELVQDIEGITPTYVVDADEGPDHSKTFIVTAMVDTKRVATGKGKSKQGAAQQAARKALEIYKKKASASV